MGFSISMIRRCVGRQCLPIGTQREVPCQEWVHQPRPSQGVEKPRYGRDDPTGLEIENPLAYRSRKRPRDVGPPSFAKRTQYAPENPKSFTRPFCNRRRRVHRRKNGDPGVRYGSGLRCKSAIAAKLFAKVVRGGQKGRFAGWARGRGAFHEAGAETFRFAKQGEPNLRRFSVSRTAQGTDIGCRGKRRTSCWIDRNST